MEPLISVCIPAYNNEVYITETILSVLNQTYRNFEIVIADDCSTDNTVEMIRKINDPRIKLTENEKNLGMQGNWNKVLSLATGEYMKLLCADDIIEPSCLELQLNEFLKKENSDVVLVSARRKIIKSDGKESFGAFYKLQPGKYSCAKVFRYCAAFGTNLIGEPMVVLFKASVFKENKVVLDSNNYLIDMDMYAKIGTQGSLIMMKECLGAFRIYDTSMSGSLGLKHARYFREFITEKRFKTNFKLNWFHILIGSFMAFNLNIARNFVFYLSRK